MVGSSIAKPIHPILKACSIVAGMGSHELLHFVAEAVYLIQRIAFALHFVGFGACMGLAFEGERVDDGVVALVAVVERPFDCPPFFFGRVTYNTLKNHPSFANGGFK